MPLRFLGYLNNRPSIVAMTGIDPMRRVIGVRIAKTLGCLSVNRLMEDSRCRQRE